MKIDKIAILNDISSDNINLISFLDTFAKFSQNEKLKTFLLNTGTRVLVEASPYDKIWGIGLSADQENIENPLTWNGENLLGFALMEVRDLISE